MSFVRVLIEITDFTYEELHLDENETPLTLTELKCLTLAFHNLVKQYNLIIYAMSAIASNEKKRFLLLKKQKNIASLTE